MLINSEMPYDVAKAFDIFAMGNAKLQGLHKIFFTIGNFRKDVCSSVCEAKQNKLKRVILNSEHLHTKQYQYGYEFQNNKFYFV